MCIRDRSGGMRQRVVIAIALACDPDLLICDEPTTALDVTIQAKILELIRSIQRERGISVIYITHDPVSYTHLDVYKRQECDHGTPCRPAA